MKIILIILFVFVSLMAENTGKFLSVQNGRYIFGQISNHRSDQYMLDTQTGRLWQMAITADSSMILQEVKYKKSKIVQGMFLTKTKSTPLEPDSAVSMISVDSLTKRF